MFGLDMGELGARLGKQHAAQLRELHELLGRKEITPVIAREVTSHCVDHGVTPLQAMDDLGLWHLDGSRDRFYAERQLDPERDSAAYRSMPAGKAMARLERRMQQEPTQDEERRMLQRHAWRYHRRCGGKGYRMRNGEIEGCSCAEKRMRRYLSKRGAL